MPGAGHYTRVDSALRARVQRILDESAGRPRAKPADNILGSSSLALGQVVFNNPPLKYLRVRASCGNSYLGPLPRWLLLKPTFQLFEAYGLKLSPDAMVACEGVKVLADGYNPVHRVGFCLMGPKRSLPEETLVSIDQEIERGLINLMVADADLYECSDVAGWRAPLAFYLASVVDYLDWLHGEEYLDRHTVFGITGRF